MKLVIDKVLENNVYKITLSFAETDVGNYMEGVHDFGEPKINLGGEILDDDGTTKVATLADRYVAISDIINTPFKQNFPAAQYGDITKKVVERWILATKEKITQCVMDLSAKVDDFTGNETIEL